MSDAARTTAAPLRPIVFYALISLAMLSWGGSWVTAKLAAGYPPLVTALWRFLFTALSFLPILLWRGESLGLPRGARRWVATSAVMMVLYNVFFLDGLKSGGGGYGGVLVPTVTPLFAFVIALLVLRERVGRLQLAGLALGLVGGLLQVVGPTFSLGAFLRPENVSFLVASAWYAILVHSGARALRHISVFQYSFWLFFASTLLVLPFALREQPFALDALGGYFWLNVFYLTLAAGTFGTTLYFEAAHRIGAARASSFSFLVPVSALALAFLFLGEEPAWTSVVGGALSVAAVLLVQKRDKTTPPLTPAPRAAVE